MGMLANQLNNYSAIFGDLANAMVGAVNDGQREINREFTPVIAAAMEPAYEYCANERGECTLMSSSLVVERHSCATTAALKA